MTRVKEDKKLLTRKDKEELAALEEEREWLFELLAETPGDKVLVTALNELDIKIVRLSGEKSIEY